MPGITYGGKLVRVVLVGPVIMTGAAREICERRAFQRAALDAPVMLDASSSYQSGRAVDVSAGGLLVRVEDELQPGMHVDVYFELPSRVAVECRARVLRSHGDTLALRFEQLDERARVALRSHCRVSGIQRTVPTRQVSGQYRIER